MIKIANKKYYNELENKWGFVKEKLYIRGNEKCYRRGPLYIDKDGVLNVTSCSKDEITYFDIQIIAEMLMTGVLVFTRDKYTDVELAQEFDQILNTLYGERNDN